VDVRLLSATHKTLADQVAVGSFREDLFYRINVIELRVPALRERREDITELASSILVRLARRNDIEVPKLSNEADQALRDYAFPGNVRELENILERALTLCAQGEIGLDDLRLRPLTPSASSTAAASATANGLVRVGTTPAPQDGVGLGSQLEGVERDAIVKALEQARYNKTAAAKALGMTFRALRYRIKKLGIE
jgi:two-component system response regulator PilR (NtrC family)